MSKSRSDLMEHPDQANLLDVPADVVKLMSVQEKFSTQTVSHLAQACTTLHRMFQTSLDQQATILIKKLLRHIVCGELNAAKEMINHHPGLLLHRGTVVDPVGRTIDNVTPFQCALGADDVEMWQMILPFFDRLRSVNPEAERQAQFNQFFVERWQPQSTYDFSDLCQMILTSSAEDVSAALSKKNNESVLCQQLAAFRKAIYVGHVNGGMHFNSQLLIDAYRLYDDVYDVCSQSQRDLIWRQVIGYIQSLLPVCKAHLLAQGLNDITVNRSGVKRTLQLHHGGADYYSLIDRENAKGLGFDVAIAASLGGVSDSSLGCEIEARELRKLFRKNAEVLDVLRERLQGSVSLMRREI